MAECISGISSMAMRQILSELAEAHRDATGERVAVESVGGVDAARRVEAGELFDFVVLAAESIGRLEALGLVDPDTRTDLARSRVAIAVRAGARRPPNGSERDVRDALLAAAKVGYSTGPSGRHLQRLLDRWGVAEAMAPRLLQAPPGVPVGTMVARGEVELGFQQLSELINLPEVDVVGALPPEIQEVTVFSGAVCVGSARPAAAKALLRSWASTDTAAIKRRHGMEP